MHINVGSKDSESLFRPFGCEQKVTVSFHPTNLFTFISSDLTIDMNLIVENITLEDVKNTGSMFDGQDPAVTLTIGKTTLKTARLHRQNNQKANK